MADAVSPREGQTYHANFDEKGGQRNLKYWPGGDMQPCRASNNPETDRYVALLPEGPRQPSRKAHITALGKKRMEVLKFRQVHTSADRG